MRNALLFLVLPLVFVLSKIGNTNEPKMFFCYTIYVIIDFLMSICLSFVYMLFKRDMKLKVLGIMTVALVLIDQGLKFLVSRFQIQINVIGEYFQIQEHRNIHQFAGLNFLNIHLNQYAVVLIKIALIVILLVVIIKSFKRNKEYISVSLLLMAAAVASLLDSILWGYTLDYFYFYNLICYDLKDFYVDAALGLILMKQVSSIMKPVNIT